MKKAWPIGCRGFTLLELLVAMFVLVILVLLTSRLFVAATTAWETGSRKTEVSLVGRAVLDYLAVEISQATSATNANHEDARPTVSGSGITFWRFHPTNGLPEQVEFRFSGGVLKRTTGFEGTHDVADSLERVRFELDDDDDPTWVDITIAFYSAQDRIRKINKPDRLNTFTKRVYFMNYNRYRYDTY